MRLVSVILALALLFLMVPVSPPCSGQVDPEVLINRFSPDLYLHPDEVFYPVAVEYFVENSHLKHADVEGVIEENPTTASISSYRNPEDNYYLDNTLGTINDRGIERAFKRDAPRPTVYARAISTDRGWAVQYWFFYVFNQGPLNTHEGDWEMITVYTNSNGVPRSAAYSNHLSGVAAQWDLVNTRDRHPNVYVALGSHANYFRQYQGKLGMAADIMSASGTVLTSEDYDIVVLNNQPWLDFAGYWGDFGSEDSGVKGERGPHGPMYIQEGSPWNNPQTWSNSMREVNESNLRREWLIHNLFIILLSFMVLGLLVQVFLKLRQKKKQGTLGPKLLPFFYSGDPKRNMGMVIGVAALLLAVAAFFLPWYSMSINVPSGGYSTGGEIEIMRLSGVHGLQFSRLEPSNGLIQVFGMPVAFGWLLLFSLFTFIFSTLGIRESGKMGRKFMSRGMKTFVPVFIIIAFIVSLASIVSSLAAPQEVVSIVDIISSRPLGGTTTERIGDYGTATISWGPGIGFYLLIAAALLLIVSGIVVASSRSNFYELYPPARYGVLTCGNCEYQAPQPPGPPRPLACPRCGYMMPAPGGYAAQPYVQPPAMYQQHPPGYQTGQYTQGTAPVYQAPQPQLEPQQPQQQPSSRVLTCANCGYQAPPPPGPPRALTCPVCKSVIQPFTRA